MANVNTVGDHTFEEVLAHASAPLQPVARAARALIAEILPGVTEVPWLRQKNVGYGVGPKKMSEHFCYIGLNKKHINLGLFYGADLRTLSEPVGGKLLFAGEHTVPWMYQTVHGAMISGLREANRLGADPYVLPGL